MTAITYREANAFDPAPHLPPIEAKMKGEEIDFDQMKDRFKVKAYANANGYQFHLAFGGEESPHTDAAGYQAILVVDTNGWVTKSPTDSARKTTQRAGDLIILDTSVLHEVVRRWGTKPRGPWLYLLIDHRPHLRDRWVVEKEVAIQMATEAIEGLQHPTLLTWLNAGL